MSPCPGWGAPPREGPLAPRGAAESLELKEEEEEEEEALSEEEDDDEDDDDDAPEEAARSPHPSFQVLPGPSRSFQDPKE
ncbi:nucleoplasmin-like protein NO29 [Poecile atricapillus]|uniref:nucleoplasmin-like protein NO29 n=1 Tax=Poecile atricapillus TaxID=48891 RepID=UPI0027390283|nr:nucleoplasmin-like protein NO29 [Poecile atricapillus]